MANIFYSPDSIKRTLPSVSRSLNEAFTDMASVYKPKKAAEDLLNQRLMNAINKPKADDAANWYKSQLAQVNAGTAVNEQNSIKQKMLNQFLPQREKEEIEEIKQRGKYYGMGGGRSGVSQQNQNNLTTQIKQDNPTLTDEQAFEAAGNLVQGKESLNDGTPFIASGLTRLSAQKAVMQGNTSALVTQQTQATQAEAEIPVIDKYIKKGVEPYGFTVGGVSPKLAWDAAHPNDEAAQTRLGEKAAADFLNFDRAAISAKMSGSQSGVTLLNEMMHAAGQQIKDSQFIKTPKSRQVALDTIGKALGEMLKARKGAGILQAGLVAGGKHKAASSPNKTYSWANINETATKYNEDPNQVVDNLAKHAGMSTQDFIDRYIKD